MVEVVLPIALFYGGIAQMLAGMWEFKKNNTFGALGVHQLRRVLDLVCRLRQVRGARSSAGGRRRNRWSGIFLLAWTIFTVYMLIASFRTKQSRWPPHSAS